ncbi:TrkH family potassium uptake protein [Methanohalophilus levihalophilus]|uniref:TrkH family potassium uptake protein n=1 Tax=Methanohalophilus levihalophilus TaxID=1431282 RepID=UPI001AE9D36B|nr:TrkH family potassium uptake protein [Methanohalophilus levihalophilus]
MRFKVVLGVLGSILWILGAFMSLPLIVSFYYHESLSTFAIPLTITILTASGLTLFLEREDDEWDLREGFLIVALGWLFAAVFGALPYVFEGLSPLNALFESMSGFTTTGATVFTDIESHSRGLLFWRSMTQWLGGMGIIMLFIAILPKLGIAGRQLFRAEAPGPKEDQLKPRIRETAKILWMVYVVMSLLEIAFLAIAGLEPYDAITHTFTTMACGGFSPYGGSVGAFGSPVVEGIIVLFMFFAGANFALHYKSLYNDRKSLLKDQEFKFYFFLIVSASLILAYMLFSNGVYSISDSLRYGIFHVVSIMTTTGYATVDFNQWSDSAKIVLFSLMFIGGCAGSTAGGVKAVRFLLLFKYAQKELFRVIHPKAVKPVRFNNKVVPDDVMQATISFMVFFFFIFFISSILLSLMGLDFVTSMSASIATLGNIGPGFALIGPMQNFDIIPAFGKLILIADMWIGRLEVFTVLVLFTPAFWSK